MFTLHKKKLFRLTNKVIFDRICKYFFRYSSHISIFTIPVLIYRRNDVAVALLRSKRRQFRQDMKSAFYWVSDSPPTGDSTENLALLPALIRKVSSDHLLRFVGEVFLHAEVEDTYTCEMKLTKTFAEFQLGWPHMHYVFAVLCLFVVVYKLTILLAKRREAQRNFQAFPGPPPHWLFGHVLEVTVSTHSQQL